MLRCCGGLLIFFLFLTPVFSQKKAASPYRLEAGKEVPLLATSVALSLSDFTRQSGVSLRNEVEEPGSVSVKSLLGLEKSAASSFPTGSKTASDWLTRGAFLLPLTLMTDADMRSDAGKLSVLYSETLLLTNGLTMLAKRFPSEKQLNRPAPELPLDENLIPRGKLSFFAGHTSVAASLSFCTAKIWSDYHPESKWKPLVWGAAAAIPAATGYFQYRSENRNFKNVAAGYALGAVVGYLVPHLHKIDRRSKRKIRVSSSMIDGTPVFVVRGLL